MDNHNKKKITIIGSGLAGSFLAVLLAQRGYKVDIYERLAKKEICDVASKRSYNIVLFGYGIEMLKKADLWQVINPHLLPLTGTVTHIAKDAKPIITLVNDKKMPYFTIARARLAGILLEQASSHPSVTLHYETTLLSINRLDRSIVLQNTQTKKISTVSCDVLIGADGANSLVRPFLQQGQQVNHIQEYAKWRYKQFLLSPEMVKTLNLETKFVHVWTQKKAFVILHPDSSDSLAALLVFPKSESSYPQMDSPTAIKSFFKDNFPDLLPALQEITPSLLDSPDGNFATIHTDPWYYKDFITIVGDAAHGFYPFFGQGTSAAFGDCMELATLIDQYGTDWGEIFPLYQDARKKHTDILGELSKEVIIKYLRHKKGDFEAIYDKLEFEAHRRFPKFIYPPLSQSVISDPTHAADHKEKYLKQRKIADRLGFSLLVTLVVGLVTLYELIARQDKH